MKNLAGDRECDNDIRTELAAAGIEGVKLGASLNAEVPASVVGKLGPFTFTRAWYYWSVSGPMPLNAAEAMYADHVGKTDVRVAGHCGCPPPAAPWVDTHVGADGAPYPVIRSYHIDSAAGLRLFADTVRSAGLDKGAPVVTEWTMEATEAVVTYFATTPDPSPVMTRIMLDPLNCPEVNWKDERVAALRAKHLPPLA